MSTINVKRLIPNAENAAKIKLIQKKKNNR